MKKKLLIINKAQFGYHIDTYKYTVYLKEKWDITYYCFDSRRDKVVEIGVDIVYCSNEGSFLKRALRFFSELYTLIRLNKFDIVFIVTFNLAFFVRFFSFKINYILDIRTASVSNNKRKEFISNTFIKLNVLFFKNITVITKGVAKILKIKKYHVLPLGADIISSVNKDFTNLELLYIGTLDNRNISKTIEGFHYFRQSEKKAESFKYHIFGAGADYEVKRIIDTIEKYQLQDFVIYHGYKKHSEMQEYFDKCNVGVSFVPMTPYYEHQPPTKTFEYILSGMVCVATQTEENRKLIKEENGVLCEDNPMSFSNSLKEVYLNRPFYQSDIIRETMNNNSWILICRNNLEPYLSRYA